MKFPLNLVFLCLILFGCATQQRFEQKLAESIGKDEIELIRHMGPPHNVYESGGSRFLTYTHTQDVTTPAINPMYNTQVVGNSIQTIAVGGVPSIRRTNKCEITYEIVSGKIVNTRWAGNACKL